MAIVHVLPVDDLKPHEESSTCKCEPRIEIVEGGMLVVHNSWDGREWVEKANDILQKQGRMK